MGKIKYKVDELFKKSPVIEFSSIARIVNSTKQVEQYDRQLIRNLILKGKIKRLTKGYYTIYDEPSLAVFCFQPAYLGLQDALSLYNIWDQESIPIIITAKKARQGIRKILDTNVLIRRINKKYIFGFEYHRQGKFYLPCSDIEKSVLDMIYFDEKINTETMKEIAMKIKINKLREYLKQYPKNFSKRVIKILNRVGKF